ncbi:MAG: aminotransferase class IV [Nitrospirales bacterium]|nr:aminotransferase class IV [Nitrospira sp.]MDR4500585.1 aminotransferase class IV [Nitrospirales bacterium]
MKPVPPEWIYVNDRFVPRAHAVISVFDHGFLYGDGVFETLRAYDGKFFQLEAHIDRLRESCERIGLALPFPQRRWPELLAEILSRNELSDALVRVTISRGVGEIGLDPELCPRPTVVMMARMVRSDTRTWRERGVRLTLVKTRRNPTAAQPPAVKALSFLNNILAKHEADQAGGFDAIMLNMDGFVTECTTSNIFFVHQKRLHTPSVECGILRGVTRDVVLSLARENGMSVQEGIFSPEQLLHAEECFITNTGLEVMPVSEIQNCSIGTGFPGVWTMKIHELFQANLSRFLDRE